MQHALVQLPNPSLSHLSPGDCELLLANARLLQRAAVLHGTQGLLRGKNLGLMCESADGPDALLFWRAASDLGAHVSHIRPGLSDLSTPAVLQHTARMLGRLYHGIECQGLSPDLVRQMAHEAGVPVYDGVAGAEHPTAVLAAVLGGDESAEQNRQVILQAVLVSTLG